MNRPTASMTQNPEKDLIRRAQQGDQPALSTLLTRYQQRLYNVILRMVSHRDDAAELTQDAMLKIVQGIGGFQGHSSIATWMTRIAMNLAISHLRKRRLRKTASLDQGYTNDPEPDQSAPLRARLADPREPGPDTRVQTSEQLERLRVALDHLPEDFRAVIVLRDIDQMDYQQVADVLELPLGTVKSRLFRARLALRDRMLTTKDDPDEQGGVERSEQSPDKGWAHG